MKSMNDMRYYDYGYIVQPLTDCAEGIIMGTNALVINCLSTAIETILIVATKEEWLGGLDLGPMQYKYIPDIDDKNFLNPINDNEKLFIPTSERAIIDAIRYPDFVRDEYTLQAIVDYCDMRYKTDHSKLYEVAAFYGIGKEEMDYRIEDARDFVYTM